ncbi:MAG: SurA N-terminal domain-containing protein [Pseudomonadales bacterium]|jgi:peptidyl-prolyl cis-trans isomerase D|nr:SurA N-terminal domain-containing protein [Pseudomonadales bacterium]MDP6473128.1 SurA N-terminal domain-containing protein [Pseudomonadales bacterium]MDP6826115.1 SurA N-terminal domain-containing protein [Pseudomonadales bacterium]MDP6971509.1 SurA N-terminal domain-containing protein [Pseudomonadales bacterium]|tara:strand:- start:160 stop:2055 length:1896 start_codon:yes stop_codon:yes gene_type:complete
MLQKLRDQTQSRTFQVIVILLIASLALFGFGAFNVFLTRDINIASVNGEEITQAQLSQGVERERRQIVAQYGEQIDAASIDPAVLQGPVLQQLISRAVLRQSLDDLGIQAAKDRVDRMVVANPNFQIGGRFDNDVYRRTVQALGYTPQHYLDETSLVLSIEQLSDGVSETSLVSDWEIRQLARLVGQKRDLAYLKFTIGGFEEQISLTDEDIDTHYFENQLQYVTPESVDVEYVVLDLEQLLDDPSIEIGEQQIASAYEADKAEATDLEQRDSSHILLRPNDERDEPTTVRLLEDIKSRIEKGASFEELAKEYSEDPGSAGSGGSLGLVGSGVFDPAFEAALWALEEDQLSEPVKSEFGYHLIRLDGVQVREYPSLEEQRVGIEARLRREEAQTFYADKLNELDNLAFEQYDSLDGIAAAMQLEIQNLKGITRDSGLAMFEQDELRGAVFGDDVLVSGNNTAAISLDDTRAVVARVTDRFEPEQLSLEDVREEVVSALSTARAAVFADEAHIAALARIEAGESVLDIAESYGLEWQRHTLAIRNQPGVPVSVSAKAFELARPLGMEKSVGTADLPDGQAIVTVTRVLDGDLGAMTDSEADSMRDVFQQRTDRLDFAALFQAFRDAADIEQF